MTLNDVPARAAKDALPIWISFRCRDRPSSRCRLQFTTQQGWSRFSRAGQRHLPEGLRSSVSPSPMKAYTRGSRSHFTSPRHGDTDEARLVERRIGPTHRHVELPKLRIKYGCGYDDNPPAFPTPEEVLQMPFVQAAAQVGRA